MKLGYSRLLKQYIAAERINQDDCNQHKIVCPACSEPLFKVTRTPNIHYLSHYKNKNINKNTFAQCELRVLQISQKLQKKGKDKKKKSGMNKVMIMGKPVFIKELENRYSKKISIRVTIETNQNKKIEQHQVLTTKNKFTKAVDSIHAETLIYIEGKLHTRYWEDEKGEKLQRTEIIATIIKKIL